MSFEAQSALTQVGQHIRTARLRRGESESLAATRVGVSRQTWRRLEEGSPKVALGLFFEAMTIYGFAAQLFELAHPEDDVNGMAMDAARRPQRGRS